MFKQLLKFVTVKICVSSVNFYNSCLFQLVIFPVAMLFCLLPSLLFAQNVNIIPQPKSFINADGQFQLNGNSLIGMNDNSLLPQANYLQTELSKLNGPAIAVDQDETKAAIDLKLNGSASTDGSYQVKIQPQRIIITASGNEGIFYGIVSLLQIIRNQQAGQTLNLPCSTISDAPRYQWRGLMLDESRHFFGKKKVEQLLDWMAFYKLNKFHWHLTDANGWRLEIKKYPRLSSVGAIGNKTDTAAEAKFYTQDEIREIVAYAQDRFITVVPEIDMPGHASASNRAYPEFNGGSAPGYPNFTFDPSNQKVYPFLADILKETNTLFPAHMIHLGGDEVALGMQAWAGKPAIMDMMSKNNFTALSDLEHYFFRRMADTVISFGDKVLCWDEAAETDLPADKTIIFWWRQNVPASLHLALQKKYEVVLCPRLPMYLDFVQNKDHISGRKWKGDFSPVTDIYNFPDKQLPADELNSNLVLGVQANLWTELVGSEKRLEFMIFPRIAALAEAGWTDAAVKDEDSFNERLKLNFKLYDKENIYYYNPFDPAAHPEAIDFTPNLIKHEMPKTRHRHGRKVAAHHGRLGKPKVRHHAVAKRHKN